MKFYNFIKGLAAIIFRIIYRIEVHGNENILEDSKMIVCSNHIHNFDPILVAIAIKNRQVHFMAKKELFTNKFFGSFIKKLGTFPVDRNGADLSAIKKSLKILKDKKVLGIFPEGTRVTEEKKPEVKPGVAMIALKSKAPVLPVYIESTYKIFSKIDIYIGQPMDLSNKKEGKMSMEDYKSLSNVILNEIYRLKQNI